MVVTQGSKILAFDDISIKMSLKMYSSIIVGYTHIPLRRDIPVEFDFEQDGKLKFLPMRVGNDTQTVVTFYPEHYVNLLNKEFPPICADYTVQELLSTLGIRYEIPFRTEKVHWIMPAQKLKSVIDTLTALTLVNTGGGAIYNFGLDGVLRLYDLKSLWRNATVGRISGVVDKEELSTEWINTYPGKVHLTQFTEEGQIETDLLFEENYGLGSFNCRAHKETLPNAGIILRNSFYRNYFQEKSISVTEVQPAPPHIGTKVKLLNDNQEYLVQESEVMLTSKLVNISLIRCRK